MKTKLIAALILSLNTLACGTSSTSSSTSLTEANVTQEKKSYRCEFESASRPSDKLRRKPGKWDISEKTESLTVTVTIQGCQEGDEITVVNYKDELNGMTGKSTTNLEHKTQCVKQLGTNGTKVPLKKGVLAVRITATENDAIKSIGVASSGDGVNFASEKALSCEAL